jgi:predicted ATPase
VISRIFIDNYRCFTNFEYRPGDIQLILGDNGSGKTSLFDALCTIRDVIARGLPSDEAFPTACLTAWDNRALQSFELDVSGNGGLYRYRLVIDHDRPNRRNRIQNEELTFDGNPLFLFDGRDAHLFRDGHSAGPTFPFDWSRSAIATIPSRADNQRLTWFRNRIGGILVFSPDPVRMTAQSLEERSYPDRRLYNLASWLRHLWQQRADFGATLLRSLTEVIDGLGNIHLEPISNAARELQFDFRFNAGAEASSRTFRLSFDALSDGQRMLVALYAILLAGVNEETTLCLDEPDNFVSLREIQPWLIALRDRVQDNAGQCLLISHHPELINYLAPQRGIVFSRDESGPVRLNPFPWSDEEVLSPAELVARGWK